MIASATSARVVLATSVRVMPVMASATTVRPMSVMDGVRGGDGDGGGGGVAV